MPVSTAVLTTPFGDYRKTVWYDTADVTALLHAGQNLAAAMLGNGFYNESIKTSWDFNTADWRDSPKLMFSLELVYPGRDRICYRIGGLAHRYRPLSCQMERASRG